jgi:hypothetical protein
MDMVDRSRFECCILFVENYVFRIPASTVRDIGAP